MTLLAFDTSTPQGSVALGDGAGKILARRFLGHQEAHASALVPAIADVLRDAGLARSDLEAVVVGAGPGSFTGLRVGAATAKGLVRGMGVPLLAVSSLAAGAVAAGLEIPGLDPDPEPLTLPDRPRYVLFDARGDRVYGACYRMSGGSLETLVPPHGGTLSGVLDGVTLPGSLFCGGGARRHEERIRAAGFAVLPEPAGVPTAEALLHLVERDRDRWGVESPSRWEPEYLRAWKPG